MGLITPYALPAVLALAAKAGLFFYARQSRVHNLQTQLYLLFLFSLSVQNIAEITFFTAKAEGLAAPSGGIVYFSASIIAIALLLHLALALSVPRSGSEIELPKQYVVLVYLPALALEVLLLFTPLLVAGFQPLNYTYTKIPGPLYSAFEMYTVGYLALTVLMLIRGAARQQTSFRRQQNKILLAGLVPIVILVIAIVLLQHVGFRGFNTTATLPVAVTFFLAVTAYATHQYRLFDVDFFIPWSKVRKRKTAFYRQIQALIAEIAGMSSVQNIIRSISNALHCPVALIGGPAPALAVAGEAHGIARFPVDELKKIDQIVVANEIAQALPSTHALMKRHKVAAIVPFHPHSQAAASWMLLGEAFSEQVYSPLDFKTVETLFARLADHFLDNQLLLRSQLLEAQQEMNALHKRLVSAWEQIETLRQQLAGTNAENHQVPEQESAPTNQGMAAYPDETEGWEPPSHGTFDEQVAAYEMRLISRTMFHCKGDVSRAAELLGLSVSALDNKLQQADPKGTDLAVPEVLFV